MTMGQYLYAENSRGGDISVIDLTQAKTVRTISWNFPLSHPDDILSTPDGRTLYVNCLVSDPGNEFQRLADQDESLILALDAASGEVIWNIKVRGMVGHMAMSPGSKYLYVALFDRFYVARIDVEARTVTYIPVWISGGHSIRINADGTRLYVGSITFPEMNVINLDTGVVEQRIYFRDPVRPFDVKRDASEAYVQLSFLNGFKVVDLASGRITASIHHPDLPPGVQAQLMHPNTVCHGLVLTPDERMLVSVSTVANMVYLYEMPSYRLIAGIEVGQEPSWVITDAKGGQAFVSNRVSGTISVISLATATITGTIKAGHYPQRMIAP